MRSAVVLVALLALGLSADAYGAPPSPPSSVLLGFNWHGIITTEQGTRLFSVVPEGRDLDSLTRPYACRQSPIDYKRRGGGWRAMSMIQCHVGDSLVVGMASCDTPSVGSDAQLVEMASFGLIPPGGGDHYVNVSLRCKTKQWLGDE